MTPAVEAKYFQWRKERYDGLAVGRKRDNGWWNALDSQKHWQHWLNEEINEIIILPTPSRSFLEIFLCRVLRLLDVFHIRTFGD